MSQPIHNQPPLSSLIFLGGMRSIAGFPFEHPLELMKITAQANPKDTSWQIIHNIVKEKGGVGFFDTCLTNFPRRLLREAVRWPVIGYTHELLMREFPETFTRESTNAKVVTGISVALFDSLLILPLEQLMAYRVKERERYLTFFQKKFTQDGISSLYRGLGVNVFRQGVVWTTLMTINHESKKRFDVLDQDKANPHLRQAVTSVLIAIGLITWGLPIDFVKTRIQMDADLQQMKLSSVVRQLVSRHGFSGFYAGALPVFVHTVFHATLGGYILDKIFASD
ncbi:MAG: MC/SLC25 family protein [Parachlamydiaceae bacterium]